MSKVFSPKVAELVSGLQGLPGVGPKSAQRMALHLLERDRDGGKRLAAALGGAMDDVQHCKRCRNFTEAEICGLCESSHRTSKSLCVVETPGDVVALEEGAGYDGQYFILMGRLSPLDGVGPADIGLDILEARLEAEPPEELILAINPTVEGEVTANYITDLARPHSIRVSRIACGVPMGGELGFVDRSTLAHAFATRS